MVSNAFGARLKPTRSLAAAMLYDLRNSLVRGEDVTGAAPGARTTDSRRYPERSPETSRKGNEGHGESAP
jgi:hypothetical protein